MPRLLLVPVPALLLVTACGASRPAASPHGAGRWESPPGTPRDESGLAARYGGRDALEVENGEASYYGDSLAGHRTASGERYEPSAFTAAHRTLALGSVVRVTRSKTGDVVYVRITDRGPYGSSRRIIDLSRAAAASLHMIRAGIADVRLDVLAYGQRRKNGSTSSRGRVSAR